MPETHSIAPAQPARVRGATGVKPINRCTTGPYSRALDRGAVGGLNGNSAEAKFIKSYAAMLTEHIGGNPSAIQRQLIIRASRLALHLELWDRQTIPNGGAFTATGHNHYIAWANCLTRTLGRLGLEPRAAAAPMDAVEYGRLLDERRAREEAAA